MDYVIIVAGGKGLRMGTNVPKQFLPINGLPVLMRTIERFREYSLELKIIVVLPEEQREQWEEMCKNHHFTNVDAIADAGSTRFHSVKSGLSLIPEDAQGVVAIHDGVRPFPSLEVISSCFETARSSKAVIPVVPVLDTLRRITSNGTELVPREDYLLAQTPQTFEIQLIKKAYEQPYEEGFTDDASVVEKLGHLITLIDGNRENIKITTPYDLRIAKVLV
ncbi:MAG: 2-C-methyl-D-erythritol 4-phosphate cytidylyltransferase [Prevotella sp.]|nr:2-C-methyl-D-erythritol 4-phosphate cytidylyltransferase [Prevotella sp.]